MNNIKFRKLAIGLSIIIYLIFWPLSELNAENSPKIHFTIDPYLQNASQNSIAICWKGSNEHTALVRYNLIQLSSVIEKKINESNQFHCANITGLHPQNEYRYEVILNESGYNYVGTFKTLADSDSSKIFFNVIGDTRDDLETYKKIADLASSTKPDFVLHLGDLTENEGTLKDWEDFFNAGKSLLSQAPIFPVLGNHDESDKYFDFFNIPNNKTWYSFNSGPVHFAAVDTYFSAYAPGSPQYEWLEKDLLSTKKPWKIVFMHAPPYGSAGTTIEVRDALCPLFEKVGVHLVLSGHDHLYQRSIVNGINYVVSGGGGSALANPIPGAETVALVKKHHFLKIEATEKTIQLSAIDIEGKEIDSFRLNLSSPQTPSISPKYYLCESFIYKFYSPGIDIRILPDSIKLPFFTLFKNFTIKYCSSKN